MKNKIIAISVVSALIILAALVDYYTPKPLDWTPSYNDSDKRPLGTYLVSRLAAKMFESDIVYNDSSFYQLYEGYDPEITDTAIYNYIVIAGDWSPDKESIEKLLDWVAEGNNAFIASGYFASQFEDTLGFKSDYHYIMETGKPAGMSSGRKINFSNPGLKSKKPYNYHNSSVYAYITSFDTSLTTVLGYYADGSPNFIKVRFGNGQFFINTANAIFTNYNLAIDPNNYDYVTKAISYLPYERSTIWDRHFAIEMEKPSTPLRYILSQAPLKWAYFTLMVTFFLFVFFKAKRVQRIIPVISPLKNSTLEFARTISNLYLHKKNNLGIAGKKARHLLEFIRNKYYLPTNTIDEKFIVKLAAKSGYDKDKTRDMFNAVSSLSEAGGEMTDMELIEFNEKIDNFYRKTNHGKYE